jgi:hypothetical protein
MARLIILSVLLISLASMTVQTPDADAFKNYSNCIKAELGSEATGFVLDLYYNKLSIGTFIEKYFQWSQRGDAVKCLKILGKPSEILHGVVKSPLTKLGYSLLYSSNCQKDLGPSLILLDQIIQNIKNIKSQWKQLLITAISTGIIGYQSFNDCKDAYINIKDIWSNLQ